jgi:MFS family permease
MSRGFYTILAAQFFSALADNALLFAAIALLSSLNAADWQTYVLQQFFVFAYIVLAPFVGAFADAIPKGRVMFISNTMKIAGCAAMLAGLHPLFAYGIVGIGAATYSPAKYGILTEILPPEKLVLANGWMEGLTVASIILGAILGGVMVGEPFANWCFGAVPFLRDVPGMDSAPSIAIVVILGVYAIAAAFNLRIPKLAIDHPVARRDPVFLVQDFWHSLKLLWREPLGHVSLAVTTLFWGAGATLRLIVLQWSHVALGFTQTQAAMLTIVVGIGIAIGSILAARYVQLDRAVRVLPVGIAMGLVVIAMNFVTDWRIAVALLIVIGALGGFFVVPMNALLQHRGHLLMGAGHSIAVQNFNENLCIFGMLGLSAGMSAAGLSIHTIIIVFGLMVSGAMTVLYRRHRHDQDDGSTLRS